MTAAHEVSAGVAHEPDDRPSEPRREPPRLVRVALTGVVIVPFVTAVLRAVRNDWFPIGDNALLFIRTRDVLTEDHPFLGSWTSASLSVGENMNNPGAMYDWLVAPFAHVLPPGPAAAIGVATINIAMVCVISATAHRIGGWSFQRWALLATALMAWSMGSELLIDIWQANALIIVFLALLILAVGIASGDDGLLPGALVIASLILQTHISYAYVFAFIALGVIGVRIWLRREIDSPRWRRHVVVSVGIVAVLWAPSFWEQFFGPGRGNMSRLIANSSGGDFSLGLANATEIVGSLGLRPPFWGRSGYVTTVPVTKIAETPDGRVLDVPGLLPLGLSVLGIALLLGVLALLTVRSHRAARRTQTSAGVLAGVVLVGSVLALSRLTIGSVGLSPHHVRWAWPAVAFVHLVVLWLVIDVLLQWWTARSDGAPDSSPVAPSVDRGFDVVAFTLIGLVSILNIPYLAQPSGPTAEVRLMSTMRRIEPQLEPLADVDPVLYDVSTLRVFEPYSSTMMMWMQEQGIEFRVDDEGMIRQLGEERRADGSEGTRVFQLEGSAARSYEGPACRVAEASPLTADDDERVRQLLASASERLATSIGTTPEAAFGALVRREFDVFEPGEQALVDTWIDSAYVLFADGEICGEFPT